MQDGSSSSGQERAGRRTSLLCPALLCSAQLGQAKSSLAKSRQPWTEPGRLAWPFGRGERRSRVIGPTFASCAHAREAQRSAAGTSLAGSFRPALGGTLECLCRVCVHSKTDQFGFCWPPPPQQLNSAASAAEKCRPTGRSSFEPMQLAHEHKHMGHTFPSHNTAKQNTRQDKTRQDNTTQQVPLCEPPTQTKVKPAGPRGERGRIRARGRGEEGRIAAKTSAAERRREGEFGVDMGAARFGREE